MESILDLIAADVAKTLDDEFTLDREPLVSLAMLRWRWGSHSGFFGPFMMEAGIKEVEKFWKLF